MNGRRKGVYPALVTEITIDANENKISNSVSFTELSPDHPLAKDFRSKSAVAVQVCKEAKFEWSTKVGGRSGRGLFVSSDHGGGSKMAAKLLWEAKRAIALINSHFQARFSPIPVLWRLDSQAGTKRLERRLAANLAAC